MPTVSRTVLVITMAAAALSAQVSFEVQGPACAWAPPTACGAAGDPEGISWNGVLPGSSPTVPAFGVTVGTANGAGMPCGGLQFLRVQGANPGFAVIPNGGPIPEAGSFSRVW